MENIIKEMVEKAIWYKENLNFIDEAYDLLKFVRELIYQLSIVHQIGEILEQNLPKNIKIIHGFMKNLIYGIMRRINYV